MICATSSASTKTYQAFQLLNTGILSCSSMAFYFSHPTGGTGRVEDLFLSSRDKAGTEQTDPQSDQKTDVYTFYENADYQSNTDR